jgi:hypothetical protein
LPSSRFSGSKFSRGFDVLLEELKRIKVLKPGDLEKISGSIVPSVESSEDNLPGPSNKVIEQSITPKDSKWKIEYPDWN